MLGYILGTDFCSFICLIAVCPDALLWVGGNLIFTNARFCKEYVRKMLPTYIIKLDSKVTYEETRRYDSHLFFAGKTL